ncbi:MAG: class I SAM-dependent methyltransferase [Candidatus Bathyarchaeota archaeon]|nr:class I SAM-dependent methyltransferase [Candidatus Bathyarchaeum tardum]WGM90433.1 MAG: class I SAM-dependent methyltransferase [Candidatus Bathyarchaeum tardum]WNZ29497.1 MAG: class I SAM-dependent methyltransferase [Candidatus Bathyarchaeota archaeon]
MFQLSYWERRYKQGGTSGEGSVDESRDWKWKIIDEEVNIVENVVDVGCGDLTFWLGRDCKNYTGIDISETILKKNKATRPQWKFIHSSSDRFIENLKAPIVFCFDMLFHIMDEDSFVKTVDNVCRYSSKYLFIYTWKKNPFSRSNALRRLFKKRNLGYLKYLFFPSTTDTKYQYFRSFDDYMSIFEKNNFQRLKEHEYPDKVGCMYVFKKLDS